MKYKVVWTQRMDGKTNVYVDEYEAASAGCALGMWSRTPWCNAHVIGVFEDGCWDTILRALKPGGDGCDERTAKVLD